MLQHDVTFSNVVTQCNSVTFEMLLQSVISPTAESDNYVK